MLGSDIDVLRVVPEVTGHPYFVAPPGWFDQVPWMEQLQRPLVDGRLVAPMLPRTVGVVDSNLPEANFQVVNFARIPAVDARAREFLEDELDERVAFHPLPPHAQDRWLAQIFETVDALDEDHCDWRGREVRTTVYRYAFRLDVLATLAASVFVLSRIPSGWFCLPEFVKRYESSGLTGLRFERVMRMPGY